MNKIIKGEVFKNKKDETILKVSVDDLMHANTPHVVFWTCLLMNDLIVKVEGIDNFEPTIKGLILEKSKDEAKNQHVCEMMDKFRQYFWISVII